MTSEGLPFRHSTSLYEDQDKANQKSLDITLELVKQQITLSSVLIGLSLAFASNKSLEALLGVSILLFILSIICGVLLISTISTKVRKNSIEVITSIPSIKKLGMIQGFAFISGLITMALSILA